jgi:hypothetical protein
MFEVTDIQSILTYYDKKRLKYKYLKVHYSSNKLNTPFTENSAREMDVFKTELNYSMN